MVAALKATHVQVEEFVEGVFLGAGSPRSKTDRPSIWHHLLSWYPERKSQNVLFLFYEDIVKVCYGCRGLARH